MSKAKSYRQSGKARIAADNYQTIDHRCVYALLNIIGRPVAGCVDVCANQGSEIVKALRNCEVDAVGHKNAMTKKPIFADWIISNLPYVKPDVDRIRSRQIYRILTGEVNNLALLHKTDFDHAGKIEQRVLDFDHELYAGQIKLRFRPFWIPKEQSTAQPMHNYVWHLWKASQVDSGQPPRIWYAYGDKPEWAPIGKGEND